MHTWEQATRLYHYGAISVWALIAFADTLSEWHGDEARKLALLDDTTLDYVPGRE